MGILLCSYQDVEFLLRIFASIVGVLSLYIAYDKYQDYLKRNRVQYLLEFGKKYTEDKEIKEVVEFMEQLESHHMYMANEMNEDNTYKESALKIHSIEMFMRFIEELELLIRAGSISESAALNLFGHYTTILDKYHKRWPDLEYEKDFWNVYRSFVDKAKKFDYKNVTI